jgi:hypothetical protein
MHFKIIIVLVVAALAAAVLPLNNSVLTTELASAIIAQLVTQPGSVWHRPPHPPQNSPVD